MYRKTGLCEHKVTYAIAEITYEFYTSGKHITYDSGVTGNSVAGGNVSAFCLSSGNLSAF